MNPAPPDQCTPHPPETVDLLRPDWPAPDNVQAFSTTRRGGYSQGAWTGLNLGDRCHDDPTHVEKNRNLLRQLASLPTDPVWLQQIHGIDVLDAGSTQGLPQADASHCAIPQVVCAILSADCLPVLFCDEHGRQVAAAHAGWRGLAGGVLEATVAAMNINPASLLAWFGPAIGPAAYEVGREVRNAFVAADHGCENTFQVSVNGRWMANLYALARRRLNRLGIDRIYGGNLCTYCDPLRFYSYRRDGNSGRMASCIWLQN